MAFTNCSRCGESFHLRITSSESIEELKRKEDAGEVLCISCFRTIKEHDVVEIVSLNKNVPEAQIGDSGAVVMVHDNRAFEIECVLSDGSAKWLGSFSREQIKWLQSPNE
ncbi:DUF4926 domain-containing protein [Enterovibrio makurazakiensis]|uniref:DUF4926 domain-containing protein n=1 Tax=Enterovibrio makurazakiensis TaxID=2910232 RepID=UPI003D1DF591